MVLAGTGATGASLYNIPHPSIEYVVEEQIVEVNFTFSGPVGVIVW